MMRFFQKYRKWLVPAGTVLVLILLFQLAGGVDRIQRLSTITANIIEGISHDPHAYTKDIEISDDEVREINITKIAREFEAGRKEKIDSVVAKIKELEAALQEARELKKKAEAEIKRQKMLEAAALEETPTHTKTGAKATRFLDPKDLPAKFLPLKQYKHEPFGIGACKICHASDLSNPAKLLTKEID